MGINSVNIQQNTVRMKTTLTWETGRETALIFNIQSVRCLSRCYNVTHRCFLQLHTDVELDWSEKNKDRRRKTGMVNKRTICVDLRRSRINVHLCVRERFCHLFSHSKRDVMSLAVVCSSSCITMEILVCRGAWTLITPSHSSVICRDTNRKHAEPGLCPACLWSLTNLVS